MLGHDGGRQHIIGTDADAEDEPDRDQPFEIRRKGLGNRHDAHEQNVEAIEPLATFLAEDAEDQGADGGADQRRAGEQAGLEAADPGDAERGEDERQDDTDRGEIVAVAKKPQDRW